MLELPQFYRLIAMVDSAQIKVKAGNGGDGLASFRREKYVEKGGPWGGDGGKGGSIIFEVDEHINSLIDFKRSKEYKAQNGQSGMKNLKKGANGEDLTIKVPLGTVILDSKGEIIKDMSLHDEKFVFERGGKGGLGNWHFKSSVNRTPFQYTEGEKRETHVLKLELKMLADVGIIGLPSAGKSSLLNVVTRASAKTAEYPFTTLEPNLGILRVQNYIKNAEQDIILADIPGLIEGAAEGKGLGHDFLKHIERTRILIHMIDITPMLSDGINPLIENYKVIRNELEKWNSKLTIKQEIIAFNKIDLLNTDAYQTEIVENFKTITDNKVLFISTATGKNIPQLVEEIYKTYQDQQQMITFEPTVEKMKRFGIEDLSNRRIIFRTQTKEAAKGDLR